MLEAGDDPQAMHLPTDNKLRESKYRWTKEKGLRRDDAEDEENSSSSSDESAQDSEASS